MTRLTVVMMEFLKVIKKVILSLVVICSGCSSLSFKAKADETYPKVQVAPAVKVDPLPSYWYEQSPNINIYPRYYDVPPMMLPMPRIYPDYIIPNPLPKRYYYIPAPVYPTYPSYVDVPVVVERGLFCKRYHWTYQRYYWY